MMRWSAFALALLLLPVSGLAAFVLADHHSGRVSAVFAVVALVLVPLLFGVAVEKLAAWRGREVRAEVVALMVAPLLYAAALVATGTVLRRPTAAALLHMPERYTWARGWPGTVGAWLAKVMDPNVGPAQSPKPSAQASAQAAKSPTAIPAEARASATFTSTIVTQSALVLTASPGGAPLVPGRYMAFPQDLDKEEMGDGCATLADVASIKSSYQPAQLRASAEALAAKRYPLGVELLHAQDDKQLSTWFEHAGASFEDLASGFDTAVHEGAHIWGFKRFSPKTQTYPIAEGQSLTLPRLSNFDRSEILGVHVDAASDEYARIYLQGKSGAQGFNMLLDEYNAYVHSLASRYCTRDLLPPNLHVSARDGILTFMYYVETYLWLARERHPKDYRAILDDAPHRQLILKVWARAEYWLRKSASDARLGLSDQQIAGWVYEPSRLAEIARVRDAARD